MNNLFQCCNTKEKINQRPTKQQEGALNLLKLLATIAIVLAHYQQTTGAVFEKGINFFNGAFNWGFMVELFFILSGYFAYGYIKKIDSQETFFTFWRKKYIRFLPLLFITGVATMLVLFWMRIKFGSAFTYSLWACLGGMFGFGRWFSTDIVLNNPTWYIDVLLLCYAVFYYATYLAKKRQTNPASAYLVVACIGILMYELVNKYKISLPFISSYIARGLICFFFGLLLRELLEKFELHKNPTCISLSTLYFIGFVYYFINQPDFLQDKLYYIMCFTVFPAVIVMFKVEFIQKLCSAKLFTHLSNVTYHTFMWHTPFRYLFVNSLRLSNIATGTRSAMNLCLLFSFLLGVVSNTIEILIKKHSLKRKNEKNTQGDKSNETA